MNNKLWMLALHDLNELDCQVLYCDNDFDKLLDLKDKLERILRRHDGLFVALEEVIEDNINE